MIVPLLVAGVVGVIAAGIVVRLLVRSHQRDLAQTYRPWWK